MIGKLYGRGGIGEGVHWAIGIGDISCYLVRSTFSGRCTFTGVAGLYRN